MSPTAAVAVSGIVGLEKNCPPRQIGDKHLREISAIPYYRKQPPYEHQHFFERALLPIRTSIVQTNVVASRSAGTKGNRDESTWLSRPLVDSAPRDPFIACEMSARRRPDSMDFRVELDIFRGPLDLLLYLVRKHEVEIVDLPIAPITEQFLEYLAVLRQIDVNAVGDFLEMASTLIEIKSRMVLPRGGEVEDDLSDPRQELVRRLLEYKKFKDAASMLEERSRQWQQHSPRLANDLPSHTQDLGQQPIQEVELWDLVSAFGRIMRDVEVTRPSNIVYDETPIHVYMARIKAQLAEQGRVEFRQLFRPGMHKSAWIGIFLAILELVRHHHLKVEQNQLFGQLWLVPGPVPDAALDVSRIDSYDHPGESADR
jgi:segregation and condensation protein A